MKAGEYTYIIALNQSKDYSSEQLPCDKGTLVCQYDDNNLKRPIGKTVDQYFYEGIVYNFSLFLVYCITLESGAVSLASSRLMLVLLLSNDNQ